ncbi:B12-binding domain-containing radical SAM protein [uncultured Paludibaculum sp.]|uniref:B12-binding domain-containing radical SAM protein n=1 Tax=uncultured Paludibaculum sp. TaxID=1765020 RepID=UPI002AAC05B3|nr:radical SAM protein [uncultured Paludibaculum sp.]
MSLSRITLVSALSVYRAGGNEEYAPPLGILTLAGLLRDKFCVEIVDLDRLWWRPDSSEAFEQRAIAAIRATRPEILGFSSISGSYPLTMRLMGKCARLMPGTAIILGGPQASVVDTATMEAFRFVDFVLRGEADETFPLLLQAIAGTGRIDAIDGLTYRQNGRVARNPNAEPFNDLDWLPLPAYDLLPGIAELRSLPLEIGRGCPFACRFCSTNDFFRRRFRLKTAARTLEQMRELNTRFGVAIIDLVHDMFTVDRRRVKEFCELLISAGAPFEWSCSARTDSVDRELIGLMKDAGCRDIFFGIETGSQRMQRVIDKDLDLAAARESLRTVDEAGMFSTVSLIAGYPEETRADLKETVRFFSDSLFLERGNPQFNILSPLPETPLTTEYRDQLFLDPDWPEISENGSLQGSADQALIASHRDIFTNFYAFPCETGRGYLRRLRDFLAIGMVRCNGVMQALYRAAGDLMAVFEAWEQISGERSTAYYESAAFTVELLTFAESQYPGDMAMGVMTRFYRAMTEDAARDGSEPEPPACRASAVLLPGVRLVDCMGDVHAVFRALREGAPTEFTEAKRPVTLVIRPSGVNRSEILELPALVLEVLRHAAKRSAIEEIRADFEARGVRAGRFTARQIVDTSVERLVEEKLMRVFEPEGAPVQTGSNANSRMRKAVADRPVNTASDSVIASRIAPCSPFHILDNSASR